MKKIVIFMALVCLCGCSNGVSKKEPVKAEISCFTEDSKFNLFLEDGQIVKYVDSIDGELGQETVDILNGEHLVGITDNDEALKIMDRALKDLDGHCEKVFVEE